MKDLHLFSVFFQDFDPFKKTCQKLAQKNIQKCASAICHMIAQHTQSAKGLNEAKCQRSEVRKLTPLDPVTGTHNRVWVL